MEANQGQGVVDDEEGNTRVSPLMMITPGVSRVVARAHELSMHGLLPTVDVVDL